MSALEISSVKHLTDDPKLQTLFAAALDARTFSYCPYSKFRVGACLLTESGEFVPGCNVENASYGLTICAERNALCAVRFLVHDLGLQVMTAELKAVAQGHKKFQAIAVTSDVKESFTYPCGACLQFMLEFGRDTPVYFLRADLKAVDKRHVRELAPFGFGPEDMDLLSQKTNFLASPNSTSS